MSLTSLKTVSLQRFSLNFAANIIATLWMLVGSTRAFSWVKPTFVQFAVFALLALGSNVLFSWLAAESGSIFNEQGLVSYLIWPMIILLGGIILARRASNQALVFVPVVLWLVADTLSALLQSLVQFFVLTSTVFSIVLMANASVALDFFPTSAHTMVGANHCIGWRGSVADYLAA